MRYFFVFNDKIINEIGFWLYKKDGKDKDFTKKVTSLSNEIAKVEEMIRKYESEIMNLTKKTKTCEKDIEQTKELQEKLTNEAEIL